MAMDQYSSVYCIHKIMRYIMHACHMHVHFIVSQPSLIITRDIGPTRNMHPSSIGWNCFSIRCSYCLAKFVALRSTFCLDHHQPHSHCCCEGPGDKVAVAAWAHWDVRWCAAKLHAMLTSAYRHWLHKRCSAATHFRCMRYRSICSWACSLLHSGFINCYCHCNNHTDMAGKTEQCSAKIWG